jgi:ligand-binding SRPBCC domain-containing protein
VRRRRFASRLAAGPDAVWAEVSTWSGVAAELAPLLRMTVPRGAGPEIRTGRLGRSWLLLGGLLPIDCDDLEIVSVTPGEAFSERSRMASASAWHHDRSLVPIAGGCLVVDDVAFEPRHAALGGPLAFGVEATFRHRHRRLRARFGEAPAQSCAAT